MNLNKVLLVGNLTRDPELRQIPSGQAVCSFGMATNRMYTDASGQRQKQAEFHNIVAWGKLAEITSQYLKKGAMAMVEGRLQTRSWQDPQGNSRSRTEIVAENIQFGPRMQGQGHDSETSQSFNGPRQPQTSRAEPDPTPIIEIPDDNQEIDVKDIPF